MPIPEFRSDGYLPDGVHAADLAEVIFRFGTGNRTRRSLALRLRDIVDLAAEVRALRILIDGSFVTRQARPGDLDLVIRLPDDFNAQLEVERIAAIKLCDLLTDRKRDDVFGAEDEADWRRWIEFFSQTREEDGRHKGLIEIPL